MASNKKDRALTDKEESLVQAMLVEDSQRKAMIASDYATDNMKPETIDNQVSKILKKPHVHARYEELKGKLVKKAEEEGILSATEVLRKLTDLIIRNEGVDDRVALDGIKTYAKKHGLLTEKVEVESKVVVVGDIDE